MSTTVNIIGAGIAGSITSTLLRTAGFNTRVIDDADKFSASAASSNLFIVDWYDTDLKQIADGFDVLEMLYKDVTEFPFKAGIKIAPRMLHIGQRHLLVKPDVIGTVTYADEQGVALGDMQHFDGPVILAAGYRANTLIRDHAQHHDIEVYAGHRYLFKGDLAEGRLDMVAPYKHGKLYQYAPGQIYYADSVKLQLKSYNKRQAEIQERTLARAQAALGRTDLEIIDFRVGYRPVIAEKPLGVLDRISKNVWSMNGGGKNGTVAYAGLARQLLEELRA
jgi:glycine/D-amino acid oxidase-like deaminating enzyme